MLKKWIRFVAMIGIGVLAFFVVDVYAGESLVRYREKIINVNELSSADYQKNLYSEIHLDNLQGYFYGYQEDGTFEVIYLLVEVDGGILTIELNYDDYYERIRDWYQENHYYNRQMPLSENNVLYGSLREMNSELETFILETQSEYLTEEMQEKIIPYIFIENQIGKFTFKELTFLGNLKIGIATITLILGITYLLLSLRKKQ